MLVAVTVLSLALAAPQTHTDQLGVLESPGGDLPFVMCEIGGMPCGMYDSLEKRSFLSLFQASEDMKQVTVELPPYDSRLDMRSRSDRYSPWSGTWQKRGPRGVVEMPFRWQRWAGGSLFPLEGKPLDVAGRWRVDFANDEEPAVAVFQTNPADWAWQPGEIMGTFLTTTGDYRYLFGTARGDELRLSCFDGAHAFLFAATLQPDGSLKGDFWSGPSYHDTWVAHRDDDAALPDAFALTEVRDETALANLRYPDLDGTSQRIGDLLGDVTLVNLFGTWCPNCGDSGKYLASLRDRYGDQGLRLLSLAFEHGDDPERHAKVVADYRETRGVDWPILLAGSSNKAKASEAFPVIDKVRSYPTTLFVDKKGAIRAVHQGFTGPATGAAYDEMCQRFERIIEGLLEEAGS